MQELVTALGAAENSGEAFGAGKPQVLQDAAERWAAHALRTFHGRHLTKALAIAVALTAFVEMWDVPAGEGARR